MHCLDMGLKPWVPCVMKVQKRRTPTALGKDNRLRAPRCPPLTLDINFITGPYAGILGYVSAPGTYASAPKADGVVFLYSTVPSRRSEVNI
jgi:hypothetical protein